MRKLIALKRPQIGSGSADNRWMLFLALVGIVTLQFYTGQVTTGTVLAGISAGVDMVTTTSSSAWSSSLSSLAPQDNNDAGYYQRFPASRIQRNKTAELLWFVQGTDKEKEHDVKRQHCTDLGMFFADDKILPETFEIYDDTTRDRQQQRKIPKIIHISSKLRCMTDIFYDNYQKWQSASGYSVLFHDDEAVYRLFQAKFTDASQELPNLSWIMACMKNRGAMMSDLWRYLLIYEYGGIYVDVDEAPGPLMLPPNDPDTMIRDEYDGLLIAWPRGICQFFLAFSPKHPFLYFTMLQTFHNLYTSPDIGAQYVPEVTGEAPILAFGRVFNTRAKASPGHWEVGNPTISRNNNTRSTQIIGKGDGGNLVVRNPPWLSGDAEKDYYKKINLTDYNRNWLDVKQVGTNGVSCWDMLYDVYVQRSGVVLDLVAPHKEGN